MARLEEKICSQCRQVKYFAYNPMNWDPKQICSECKTENDEKEKQEYLDALKEECIKVRLAKIEEWIYDHSREPAKYVPPPTFGGK